MLKDVKLGSTLNGQVISVVNFGAFIDVGCEKDVLLHVKDMSEEVRVKKQLSCKYSFNYSLTNRF